MTGNKKYLIGINKPYYPSVMVVSDKQIARTMYEALVNTDGMPTKAYLAEIIEWRDIK